MAKRKCSVTNKKCGRKCVRACKLNLFKIRNKPVNILRCRASNVWDNRWRIDVYTKYMVDPHTGLEGQEITYSCFAHVKDDKLEIKSESLKL